MTWKPVVLDQHSPTPDPAKFPVREWPCDSRNDPRFSPCPYCDVEDCEYGMCNAACGCQQSDDPCATCRVEDCDDCPF